MIPVPSGVRVWLSSGVTDMRRGMNTLGLQVQEALGRDPHVGDLYVFRGRRGDLIKILWHDGQGFSLYAKRLKRGRFVWPSPADGVVSITSGQLGYLLEGIDWRNPVHTWRPLSVGQAVAGNKKDGSGYEKAMTKSGICDSIEPMESLSPAENSALRSALAVARAENARLVAEASGAATIITTLKLEIAKLRREIYGQRSERKARLLDQLELDLEELESQASEDELAAERSAQGTEVKAFTRKTPSRKAFPDHLPRERVVIEAPESCTCCGSARIRKLGEDITETLEVIPRRWKVIQTVREKFTCRDCEKISQAPAPFHVTPRGWAGPSLLAMILFEKYGQHQPLNRQAERYAREGVDLSLSTLADQVGACTFVLRPLYDLIAAQVLTAERLHGDDTTVPVLAKGRTRTGRIWTYVRDDRPFGGSDPPAALFHYSRDRSGEHPQAHLTGYGGILQADAYGGYNRLSDPGRAPGPVTPAFCWAHGRRNFFKLADLRAAAEKTAKGGKQAAVISQLALEAVRRIDALFDIERAVNGKSAEARLAARAEHAAQPVAELEAWMRQERAKLSRHAPVAKAMDYMLKRWDGFTRFLNDGRICLTNNAAERALRGIALGRKSWLFAGSDRGGDRAAMMYTLIVTAKMNDIDPQAWLADTLARIAEHPAQRLDELLPWNRKITQADKTLAA